MHRSFTFWSGLLILAALIWAWRDSLHHASDVKLAPFFVGSGNGGLLMNHDPLEKERGVNRTEILTKENGVRIEVFPRPFLLKKNELPVDELDALRSHLSTSVQPYLMRDFLRAWRPKATWFFLPYWLLLIPLALLWIVLLVWRARRRKKRMTNAEFPNAE